MAQQQQRDIYAFDCGTTNWRLYRMSCEETVGQDGVPQVKSLEEPKPVDLATFTDSYLPAALIVDEQNRVTSYGEEAYEDAKDPEGQPFLRDAFKVCIGNHKATNSDDFRRRYTHQDALTYTKLLLHQVVERLKVEHPHSLTPNNRFIFAHPVHWGEQQEDNEIEGQLLKEFAEEVYSIFPKNVQSHILFVQEPIGALVSLTEAKRLDNKITLVIDVGGGTTDFVAGRWTQSGWQDIKHDGKPHGSKEFDYELAEYLAKELQVPKVYHSEILPTLYNHGEELKKTFNRRILTKSNQPIRRTIRLESEDGEWFKRLKFTLKPDEFEGLTQDTISKFKQLVKEALSNDLKLSVSDVGQVVLVGGGAKLYVVPQVLKEIFGESVPLIYSDSPEETVGRGAALWYVHSSSKPLVPSTGGSTSRPPLKIMPDGSGDYPTLTEAMQAIPDGGIIQLSAGEYRLTQPLLINQSVRLEGAGMDETTVVCDKKDYVAKFTGNGRLEAEGITFRHEGKAWADVVVVMGGEVKINACRFIGGVSDKKEQRGGHGLRLAKTANGQVKGCEMSRNGAVGILVADQAQPLLEENTCRENKSGITYTQSAGGMARQNNCSANKSSGIVIRHQAQPELEDNICQQNKKFGLSYLDNAGGVADKNLCENNGKVGIQVSNKAKPRLLGNTCSQNAEIGMIYLHNAEGVARENICASNGKIGISVSNNARPTLEGNTCEQNGEGGIKYDKKASGYARNNECVNNKEYGIQVSHQAEPQLESNTCRQHWYGIQVKGRNRSIIVKNNHCISNERDGIQVSGEAQPKLEGNHCKKNRETGICYIGHAGGLARRNNCTFNNSYGIEVKKQANPTLEDNICNKNSRDGIFYSGKASGIAKQNKCSGNNNSGIELKGQAEPTLEGNELHNNKYGILYLQRATPHILTNYYSNNSWSDIKGRFH